MRRVADGGTYGLADVSHKMVTVLRSCRREIESLPEEVRGDLADAPARLDAGLSLSMPLSRPMPSVGRGVHELRAEKRAKALDTDVTLS